MGVRSSMSISIVIRNDLWGLVACHGYGDAGIRVSLPIRELLRNIVSYLIVSIRKQPCFVETRSLEYMNESLQLIKSPKIDMAN